MTRLPRCQSATLAVAEPCTLPTRVSLATATRLLQGREQVWWLQGDRLTLIGRFGEGGWAMLCCAIQTPLEPIGDSAIGAVTVRVPRVSEALLDVGLATDDRMVGPDMVTTPNAPQPPPRAEPIAGTITVRTLRSEILGEDRLVSIYVPPDIAEGVRVPVIYLADGDTRGFAPILDAAVRAGR